MSTAPTSGPVQPEEAQPTTGERLKWMGRNSRQLIIALVILVVAALVTVFSFSLFTSSSANPGNVVTTGIMDVGNDQEGEAILTVTGMLPGESADGTVTIENVGDSAGDFTLSASGLDNTKTIDPPLSRRLTLLISDGTNVVYNGTLHDIDGQTIPLGTWAAGESHTYRFKVTFDQDAGNLYQGAGVTIDFAWDATQSS